MGRLVDRYRPAEIRAEVFTYLVEPPDKRPTTSGITRDSFRSQVVVGLFRVSGDMVLYFAHNTTHIINSLNGNPTRRVIEILGYDWEAMKETMERYAKQQKLQNAPLQRHLNNTRLVSKSFGAEFLTTYLIHANQVFTAEANGMGDNPFGLWQHALPLVKNCTLRLIARPGIANAFNPNHAKVEHWHLRESIFASMREMTSLRSMTLIIQACGNQLWNPVQLWYFISQAFKTSDIRAFNKVEFTMKDWQIRAPNYMQRTQDGWEWRCVQGHFASRDHDDLPIRPFAKKLYAQCRECRYMDPSSEEDED